jgi:hypothetical protein
LRWKSIENDFKNGFAACWMMVILWDFKLNIGKSGMCKTDLRSDCLLKILRINILYNFLHAKYFYAKLSLPDAWMPPSSRRLAFNGNFPVCAT